MAKILAIGEILWDVFPDREIIGGAPFNFACHVSALGGDTYIFSRVGCDIRGRAAAEQVGCKGIKAKFLQTDGTKPNGTAVVTFTSPGIATYEIPQDVSHNFITIEDETITAINAENFDLLYYGSLAQKSHVSRESVQKLLSEAKTKHRFFDVNLRMDFRDRDVLDFSFANATIVKINDEETTIVSKVLFGKEHTPANFAAALFKHYHTECVLVTLGAKGCEVYGSGSREILSPPQVTVADTVGAGDAFSAGFVHSFLRGDSIFEAARFGNATGSYVASKTGATPELVLAELETLGVTL